MTTVWCLFCERSADQMPLIRFDYRGATYHVCSQHLPVLIHDPAQLVGRLPGAETLKPAKPHD